MKAVFVLILIIEMHFENFFRYLDDIKYAPQQ